MKQNRTTWALATGLASMLGLSMLTGAASAQERKRYVPPPPPQAKPIAPVTSLKQSPSAKLPVAPPQAAARPAVGVKPSPAAGIVAGGAGNIVAGGAGNARPR